MHVDCVYFHNAKMYIERILCRSGSDEDYDEKVKLLQEISDLEEAGKVIVAQKKEEKRQAEKENQKKLMLKKQGEDIRLKAMMALIDGKKYRHINKWIYGYQLFGNNACIMTVLVWEC